MRQESCWFTVTPVPTRSSLSSMRRTWCPWFPRT